MEAPGTFSKFHQTIFHTYKLFLESVNSWNDLSKYLRHDKKYNSSQKLASWLKIVLILRCGFSFI